MSSIGDNIKIARQRMKLTQEELAQKVGVSKAAISRYESNAREPKINQLKDLANALEVTVGYLQGIDDIDAKHFYDALHAGNTQYIEELMGLPSGSFHIMTEDEMRAIEEKRAQEKRIHNISKTIFMLLMAQADDVTDSDCRLIENIVTGLVKLNPEGKEKVNERIDELQQIQKYQK